MTFISSREVKTKHHKIDIFFSSLDQIKVIFMAKNSISSIYSFDENIGDKMVSYDYL